MTGVGPTQAIAVEPLLAIILTPSRMTSTALSPLVTICARWTVRRKPTHEAEPLGYLFGYSPVSPPSRPGKI